MCLGVPGQVVAIDESGPVRMGTVDFAGIRKQVCLAYLPEIALGDYAIVHVGFAITTIDEASARQTLASFEAMGLLEEEFGRGDGAAAAESPSCPAPVGWTEPT